MHVADTFIQVIHRKSNQQYDHVTVVLLAPCSTLWATGALRKMLNTGHKESKLM